MGSTWRILGKILSLFKIFLFPFSFSFEKLAWLRRFLYNYNVFSRYKFEVPIISIGNITFGGTGKTPLTLWLAQYFYKRGKKVMILSRGYKSALENEHGILRSQQRFGLNPVSYGDEAILMARRTKNASIVVGKNRAANLSHYFPKEKPDVVLLDDGHQHLPLDRDLNIVLFDLLMPLKSYKTAPLGPMREGFSSLMNCDIVIFGKADQVEEAKIDKLKEMILPYLRKDVIFAKTRYKPTGLINNVSGKKYDISQMLSKRIVCVAGIATPNAFFLTLKSLRLNIVKTLPFPDHCHYTQFDAAKIVQEAQEHDAIIITTEKDVDKLKHIIIDQRLYYLEIETEFIDGKESVLDALKRVTSFYF